MKFQKYSYIQGSLAKPGYFFLCIMIMNIYLDINNRNAHKTNIIQSI